MKQKINTVILILISVGLLFMIVLGSRDKSSQFSAKTENGPSAVQNTTKVEVVNADTFYWGTTCPHCHDTIEWMEVNKVDDKLKVIRKEVYENRQNSLELAEKAKSCGIDESNVGVPLMFTSEGNCLVGTPDITGYLSQKIGNLTNSGDVINPTERSME